jgi:CHAT domain-containing protein/tetratricopeptide (TPR) repeat protein
MRVTRLVGIFLALAIASIASLPASFAQVDIAAQRKRLADLYAAGQYAAALVEAQRFEANVKRRGGTNQPAYVTALSLLGVAHGRLGRYEDAARAFKQALDIIERNVRPDDPTLAVFLGDLGSAYTFLDRLTEAERLFLRALSLREKSPGPQSAGLTAVLSDLANVYRLQGRKQEAEATFGRALKIAEAQAGADSLNAATVRNNLARVYEEDGRFRDAEQLYRRALAINEKTRGPRHPEVAVNINNVAHALEPQARYVEAEALYRRAIDILEQGTAPNHPRLATALNNLAVVYARQSRFDEAEPLYKRALAIREQSLGATSLPVAIVLNNLAHLYEGQMRFPDAQTYAKRSLAIVQRILGPNHPDLAKVLRKIAVTYDAQGQYREAENLLKRVIDIWTKAFGPNHPYVATALENLARVREHQGGRSAEAEQLYRRALTIQETARSADHPEVVRVLNSMAQLAANENKPADALAHSRRATRALVRHAFAETPGLRQTTDEGGILARSANYFARHVANLALAARARVEPAPALGREAFEVAQWTGQSSAAAAVQNMAARFGSGDEALSALAREKQDLGAAWRDADRRLLEAIGKRDSQDNRVLIESLRKQVAAIETRIAAIDARLVREFPDYVALTSPKPLGVADAQALLTATEALAFWLPGERETYVFAITREGFAWDTIPLGREQLSQKVAQFRVGLDPEKFAQSLRDGKPEAFNLNLAHELHTTLFGAIEPLIKDKRELLVAAAGPLTALPMQALLTEKAPVALPTDYAEYRKAAWLIKRHALTVLPAVASLQALRKSAKPVRGGKPMVGFGDPVFSPKAPLPQSGRKDTSRGVGYTEIWRGASLDRNLLSGSLVPLPDTAQEIKAVAKRLGAPDSDLYFGRSASETTLKRLPLASYRVVYFATHGLVAGDVKGLAEPALILTIPQQPTELDDGLLTASEVAQLKMNADWVVLSACNTIAGDRPGAEALSGLARAFFYAGARALLVSHWNVDSKAAAELVSSTFDFMTAERIGRAEALRRAMLAYMNNTSDPTNPYPAYWAPFVVVGDGASAQ